MATKDTSGEESGQIKFEPLIIVFDSQAYGVIDITDWSEPTSRHEGPEGFWVQLHR